MRKSFFLFIGIFILTQGAFAQSGAVRPTPTPSDDEVQKIYSEEVRLNISAFDDSGNFVNSLKKEDLVITEDGRLHQADSLSRVPANVLVIMDTGGEERRIKGMNATKKAAENVVGALQAEDSVALMEFNDTAKILSEWTTDKAQVASVITKKTGFGKRSRFVEAMGLAMQFMERAPLENRHIVLITDGTDSTSTPEQRAEAIRNFLTTNINVHVLSYTLMERKALPAAGGRLQKGEPAPRRIPEEVLITMPGPVQDTARMPRIGSVNMDKEMIRKQKERAAALKRSESDLTRLAEDTNGEIFLPVDTEEMQQKTAVIAKNIDSQYTLTYTPKRPLNEVKEDETRMIQVTARRPGLFVQGKRKLLVRKH
jgi:VWFA-related protein